MCIGSTTPGCSGAIVGVVDVFRSFEGMSFGGVPTAQYHCDFLLWERVLNDNPQTRRIVELGSWQGGFSWFLYAQTQARGMSFATYDIILPDVEPPCFTKLDFYRFPDRVVLGDSPVVLLCDGGNKPRELRTFPPMCVPGSVVVAHDWGTETLASDVPDFLEELYGGFCDEIGSVSRVFRMRL